MLLTQRRAAVSEALRVLEWCKRTSEEKGEPGDCCVEAIRVLDEYRAPEAVPALLKLLDIRTQIYLTEARPVTLGDRFPAARALASIGKPAVAECIWKLTFEIDEETREKLCWIIGAVEGREGGRFQIEKLIEKLQTDAGSLPPRAGQARFELNEKASRLRSALPVLETLFPEEE